jgi:hypothetical protein
MRENSDWTPFAWFYIENTFNALLKEQAPIACE